MADLVPVLAAEVASLLTDAAVPVAPLPVSMATTGATPASVQQLVLVQTGLEGDVQMGSASVRVSTQQMMEAAGTLDDPTRYFQILPGVQSDSDQRNDFLVRGGNPGENLFVIDGIEVPSINHLALSDTTGGLVSMIDADAIESMTLHSGAHDARFTDRLSSVVEIATTAEAAERPRARRIMEMGIAGVGGIVSWRTGKDAGESKGSTLISVRQGVLNLLTDDIGLNGVPNYTNALVRGDRSLGARNKIWGVSLTGVDSIEIHPAANDAAETNPFDVRYSGWRSTTGANWQHLMSDKTFSVLTISNAEQAQTVEQRDQLLEGKLTYSEKTHDGQTTFKCEATSQVRPWLLLSAGATGSVQRVDYEIGQPVALPSQYSAEIVSVNSTAVYKSFSTPVEGGFVQASVLLPAGLRLTAATRVTHWGFDGATRWTPRVVLAAPLGRSTTGRTVAVGFAEYSQMPPFLYQLAFAGNHDLGPIAARHLTLDLRNVVRTRRFALQLAAYDKRYTHYPVALNYPQLSLANIADTFGQSFLLFPMASKGLGRADGAEASVEIRPTTGLFVQGSLAYARVRYSGLDGVLRPGNFDTPLTARVAAVWNVRSGFTVSVRYGAASGRVYTPDDMAESLQQNRDVFDLTRVNGERSHAYGRLDLRVGQTRALAKGTIAWHVGLDNALNQKNFYGYAWQPHAKALSEQDQMPLFPDGGVKYTF